MDTDIPPISEIRATLEALAHADMQALARFSDVPFTTLWKIRDGTTANPGIETVRKFAARIEAVKAARKVVAGDAPAEQGAA